MRKSQFGHKISDNLNRKENWTRSGYFWRKILISTHVSKVIEKVRQTLIIHIKWSGFLIEAFKNKEYLPNLYYDWQRKKYF